MTTVTHLATHLQTLFTHTATELAVMSGFVQRTSKLGGAVFAQTLVFGWLAQPSASYDQLAQTATALGVPITAQGLVHRLSQRGAEYLRRLLERAVRQVVAATPVAIPVLARFNGVYIQDSTTLTLPDALAHVWRGCGSVAEGHNLAGLKVQVQLELRTGQLTHLDLQDGRAQDRQAPFQTAALPRGALRLADLGYFAIPTLQTYEAQGVFWLTRYYPRCELVTATGQRRDLTELLRTTTCDQLDLDVHLSVTHRYACRLIAVRLSPADAAARRRKAHAHARREGITLSARLLTLCDWNVFVTNVPPLLLRWDEVLILARVRWQIELLFKLWKSHAQLNTSRSHKPEALLCEVYAKLLAVLVQHWLVVVQAWQDPRRSWHKTAQTIRQHALRLALALPSRTALCAVCNTLAQCFAVGARLNTRNKHPSTVQLLLMLDS